MCLLISVFYSLHEPGRIWFGCLRDTIPYPWKHNLRNWDRVRRYFKLMMDTFEEHSWLFEELPILQIFKEYETMGIIGPMIYSIQYLAQASKSRTFRL